MVIDAEEFGLFDEALSLYWGEKRSERQAIVAMMADAHQRATESGLDWYSMMADAIPGHCQLCKSTA
jgi:hypothetical protein